MISGYFTLSWHLEQMRASCVGPYLDGFAELLSASGYSANGVRKFIRPVVHFGRWADRAGVGIASWDESALRRFRAHLKGCSCEPNHGVFERVPEHVEQFFDYLRANGLITAAAKLTPTPKFSALSEQFADWMRRHRGVTEGTLLLYQTMLRPFLAKLGEQPKRYAAESIRSFVVAHVGRLGRARAHSMVTALRAFLRFLIAEGRVRRGLALCVPKVPQWRLASLPRYLESADVARVVDSCDLTKSHGLRDHAILLLLSRLGLRAGDVVGMELDDLDWRKGTLKVRGKGRREVLLPLPQDVGDAVLEYVRRGRPRSTSSRVFLTACPPIQRECSPRPS